MTVHAASGNASLQEQLRALCHQLEAVFYRQLLEAMRESGLEGDLIEESPGEEIFTEMLHDHVAAEAAASPDRLGELLYRQLADTLPGGPGKE